MKFSQYTWNLYKQSNEGKKVIDYFHCQNILWKDIEVIKKYNPFHSKWIEDVNLHGGSDLENAIVYNENDEIKDFNNYKDFSEVRAFYEDILEEGLYYGFNDDKQYLIEPKDYKEFLYDNVTLSFIFYQIANDYCFPNLFIYRFLDINKIADAFGIILPEIPKKSDYKGRCMYYMDLCEVFYDFRIENNLSPEELCAFLYDFAPNYTNKESNNIPKPTQAYFIGGVKGEQGEGDFWQTNPETKKGDILVLYETSPISAITHIWLAKTDGVTDPFFYYYANTFLTKGIKVPKIPLKELKADAYFSNHALVRKNFQGVNGWSMTNKDYHELLNILQRKGFDTSVLPIPYTPDVPENLEIKKEKDVEIKLLEYYLNKMGFEKGKDYIKQLPIKAGRGSRIYPDYVLHYDDAKNYEKAKILIEAKLDINNKRDIEQAFIQARSYANLLEASIIILCDKKMLLIYQRKESFDRNNYQRIYWTDLSNPDFFNELKKLLSL